MLFPCYVLSQCYATCYAACRYNVRTALCFFHAACALQNFVPALKNARLDHEYSIAQGLKRLRKGDVRLNVSQE